jgi:membrane protein
MAAVEDKLPDVRVKDVNLTSVATDTIKEMGENDIPGLAAEMAYHSALAFFPFCLFLAGLTAVLDDIFGVENITERLIGELDKVLSSDATNVVRSLIDELRQSQGVGAAVFGLVGALWSGSSVIGTAMKGLNRIYNRKETRPMLQRKLLALALSLFFCVMLLTATLVFALAEPIGSVIVDGLGLGAILSAVIVPVLWFVSVVLVMLAVAVVYWLGVAGEKEFHWVTSGAAIFAIGWVIASSLFAFYVSRFSSYNDTYGSLGGIILLLVWLYWSNLLLLVGAQFNRALEAVGESPTNRVRDSAGSAATTPAQP